MWPRWLTTQTSISRTSSDRLAGGRNKASLDYDISRAMGAPRAVWMSRFAGFLGSAVVGGGVTKYWLVAGRFTQVGPSGCEGQELHWRAGGELVGDVADEITSECGVAY